MNIMILANMDLARRIDSFEAYGSKRLGEEVIRRRPNARAFVKPIGQGVAVYAGPDSPANKIIGVGYGDQPEWSALEEIEQAYFERDSDVLAEVSTLAPAANHAFLSERGYRLQGFENVLGRPISDEDGLPLEISGMTVEMATGGALATWMDIVITGFLHPDATGAGSEVPIPPRQAMEDAMVPFAELPDFHAYLAFSGDTPAGGGGLRVAGGIAQLCGASTLPAYRRRGIQSALLRRRLYDARGRGCDLAIMTTQPGSKSNLNALRQGFMLLYSRAILVKKQPSCP